MSSLQQFPASPAAEWHLPTSAEFDQFVERNLRPALAELEVQRRKVRARLVILFIVAGAIVAGELWLVAWLRLGWWALCVVSPTVGIIHIIKLAMTDGYGHRFRVGLVSRIVSFCGPGFEYKAEDMIPQARFGQSRIFERGIAFYEGSDYISGMVGRTRFKCSNVHARAGSKDGGQGTIFRGLFFMAEFNKSFSGVTVVLPHAAQYSRSIPDQQYQQQMDWWKWNVPRPTELVKLEDVVFEKTFVVYSTDQIEARYILTPALMQRLVSYSREDGVARVYLSFAGGNVFVAVSPDHDLFKPPIFSRVAPDVCYRLFKDVLVALDIIGDLNLNTRIWSRTDEDQTHQQLKTTTNHALQANVTSEKANGIRPLAAKHVESDPTNVQTHTSRRPLIIVLVVLAGLAATIWLLLYDGWYQEQRILAQFSGRDVGYRALVGDDLRKPLGGAGFVLDRVSRLTLRPVLTSSNLASLRELKQLESLQLDGQNLSDLQLADVTQFGGLRDLRLQIAQLTDAGLSQLKRLSELTSLGLTLTRATDAELVHLTGLKALDSLDLSGTQVTDAGLAQVKELKRLTCLCLDSTQVTDAGLAQVKELKRLNWLSLDSTQVTDAGLAQLKDLQELTLLRLDSTRVTDAGLVHLKRLKWLTHLSLSGVHLTDAGIVHLREMQGLRWLVLTGTNLTPDGIEQLKVALPKTQIISSVPQAKLKR